MRFFRSVPGWFERPGNILLLTASLVFLGILSGYVFSPDPRNVISAAVFCMTVWVFCIIKRRSILSVIFAFASLVLTGSVAISLSLYPFHAGNEGDPLSGRMIRIEGTIIGMPSGFRGGQSLKVLCTMIQDGSKLFHVREAMRLWVYGASEDDFSPQDEVRAYLRVKRPLGKRFPGDRDRRIQCAGEYAYLTASVEMGPRLIKAGNGHSLRWRPIRLFSERADTVISAQQHPARGVLHALILGWRYRIDPKVEESFRRSGLSHILAVSGLHVGLVGILFYSLASFALRRILFLSRRMDVRRIAAVLSIAPVVFYTMVTGNHPPAQRACIMAVVLFVGVGIERSYSQVSSLLLAALLILITSPAAAFAPSFQLSFLAAFAIMAILRRFPRFFGAKSGDLGANVLFRNILRYLLISAAAFLGTFPLAAYYFSCVAPVGVLASLLAIPLCAFIILPFGLAGGLTSLFSRSMAGIIMTPAAWGCAALAALAEKLSSSIPFFTGFHPTPAQVVGLYLVIISGLFLKRRIGRMGLLAGVVVYAVASLVLMTIYPRDGVRVTFLDVGQGDSALLELPEGKNVLVDTGGRFESYDFGASRVLPLLRAKRIRSLDALIVSHGHMDHAGGMASVIGEIPCRDIVFPGRPGDTLFDVWGMDLEKIEYRIMREGMCLDLGSYSLWFLNPPRGRDGWGDDLNDNSLVFSCRGPHGGLVFPGDAGKEVLDHISKAYPLQMKADVLKVPHHGSSSSMSMNFYDAVKPKVAVISSSLGYSGHCDPGVIGELSKRGAEVFTTCEHGSVECFMNKSTICVTTWSGREEMLSPHGFWHWFFRGL